MRKEFERGREPCACQEIHHRRPEMIVLTGGPGAGKTAILELARKYLCHHALILPESAGIVFSGGFIRMETHDGKKAAQRAIFHIQREMETLALLQDACLILCDRATLDGLAYWPESHETFFRNLEITKKEELARYQTVIHLHTPTKGYNRQNPIRVESLAEAEEIDKRILKSWEGHPNRFLVESHPNFMEKAEEAVRIITSQLPTCCRVVMA